MKKYITIREFAQILGISRIAVYKKVKAGKIPAEKIGRNYVITDKTVNQILGKKLTSAKKHEIDRVVKKVVKQYGPLLKQLGAE
ncbi:MAG: excisionase family DNA-binding protein [Sedimentisphaerales bacterium]|nr:excisionase family DNA-binding protein [Sedimentisphaerales bacterium]